MLYKKLFCLFIWSFGSNLKSILHNKLKEKKKRKERYSRINIENESTVSDMKRQSFDSMFINKQWFAFVLQIAHLSGEFRLDTYLFLVRFIQTKFLNKLLKEKSVRFAILSVFDRSKIKRHSDTVERRARFLRFLVQRVEQASRRREQFCGQFNTKHKGLGQRKQYEHTR